MEYDEPLSPKEGVLFSRFSDPGNVHVLERSIPPGAHSVGVIVDTMYEVFAIALGLGSNPGLAQLNQMVIDLLRQRREQSKTMASRSNDVGYRRSRIPKAFLPRPIFS
ncbi:unknown [Feldmannia species virus]|uniref:Uncharacterized protein n=1 Tax=Feldmannia species virus TaxID=39420 RepID=B5LWC0_9PHYC|nr:hypothetical protein FeldSpV_gp031 [Feldmannia species virus]ACH46783.1 unknown [Feldmannia species virus]